MQYRRLFLFLEGGDDQRFFEAVLIPLLQDRYEEIRPILVSEMEKEKVAEWLRSAEGMGADYIFVRDLDRFACVTAAKDAARRVHPRLHPARVQIVKMEIESWYCAGLRQGAPELVALKVETSTDTEQVTKERLEAVLRGDRVDALTAMLETFDLQAAVRRNASLRYFLRKNLGMEM